jgi:hypothetical protein
LGDPRGGNRGPFGPRRVSPFWELVLRFRLATGGRLISVSLTEYDKVARGLDPGIIDPERLWGPGIGYWTHLKPSDLGSLDHPGGLTVSQFLDVIDFIEAQSPD